jgi:FkbM family methyltransferase
VSKIANSESSVDPIAVPLSSPALRQPATRNALLLTTDRLKRAVDRITAQLGFHIVPSWRLKTLEQSRHLRAIIDQFQIDTVLDVGANVGGFRDLLRTFVGYRGRIVSFEPVREIYEALAATAGGDPSWKGYRIALGEREGELPINVTQRSTMSSFLTRDESMLRSHGYDHLLKVTEVVRSETVPLRTLDSLSDELFANPQSARVFLKCDTQGYDLNVIAGATRTLRSVLALQIELSIKPIYEGAPPYAAVMEHLRELGFDITGVFPVRRDEIWRIVNFDCVMINSRHPAVQELAAQTVRGRTP